jgi:hypothetical protein
MTRTRCLLGTVIAVVACGKADRSQSTLASSPSAPTVRAADALVLRVPKRGGTARVSALAAIDSTIWIAGDAMPAVDRMLAFDDDAGLIAFVDARGLPGRLDFRLGSVVSVSREPLRGLTSLDGSTIFGLAAGGAVTRLTPEGGWIFAPPHPVRELFPQPDGSLLVLANTKTGTVLWRLHPPDKRIADSLELPALAGAVGTRLADRIFCVTPDRELFGVATRRFTKGASVRLDDSVTAMATTPSGDRVYLASANANRLDVVDRYRERVTARVDLPGKPREVRVDPLGRYLLVRASTGDSAWVLATATHRLIGTLRSSWRNDLPLFGPDGEIVAAQGRDAVILDGETLRERKRVAGGADDFWYAFVWSGFRPRAAALDQPVVFGADSTDTTRRSNQPPATGDQRKVVAPEAGGGKLAAPPALDTTRRGFVVSFAAMLSEARARDRAAQIVVRGQTARVVTTLRDGITIFRVVLGPYATRDDAERVGRESGQTYWVFEGAP